MKNKKEKCIKFFEEMIPELKGENWYEYKDTELLLYNDDDKDCIYLKFDIKRPITIDDIIIQDIKIFFYNNDFVIDFENFSVVISKEKKSINLTFFIDENTEKISRVNKDEVWETIVSYFNRIALENKLFFEKQKVQ